jgi:hypothetical protein
MLTALVITFYFLYFQSVFKQFSDGLTNLAVSRERVKSLQLPNITICSGLNEALFKEYEITTLYFTVPDPKANVPKNTTLQSVFNDVTYQLNRDFQIGMDFNWFSTSNRTVLTIGHNQVTYTEMMETFEVKEFPSVFYGMCYVISPVKSLIIKPDYWYVVSIGTNKSLDGKIRIQLSSGDNFNSMGYSTSIPGIEQNMQEICLKYDSGTDVLVKEEITKFIKDCTTQTSFFGCWADNFLAAQPEDFNCTKKCVPLYYGGILSTTMQGFIKDILIRIDNGAISLLNTL